MINRISGLSSTDAQCRALLPVHALDDQQHHSRQKGIARHHHPVLRRQDCPRPTQMLVLNIIGISIPVFTKNVICLFLGKLEF